MRLIKNGNFSPWFRFVLALGGIFIMYVSYQFLTKFWMYLGLVTGLIIGSIGAYAEKANTLKIKPFDNNYKKAKESYNDSEEDIKTENEVFPVHHIVLLCGCWRCWSESAEPDSNTIELGFPILQCPRFRKS